MPKVLVIDVDPSGHGEKVKDYFQHDAPHDWNINIYDESSGSVSDGVDEAINTNCKMIIRSSVLIWDYKEDWKKAWDNGILTIHAHGDNTNLENVEPPYIPEFVVPVGGEDVSTSAEETSFGFGLEMDAEAYDGSYAQSWATPTIAAAIARCYNRDFTLQESRMLVRQACDSYSQGWNKEEGYGTYVSGDSLPTSLDVHEPFEISSSYNDGFVTVEFEENIVGPWSGIEVRVNGSVLDRTISGPINYYKPSNHNIQVYSYSYNRKNYSVGAEYPVNSSASNVGRDKISFNDDYTFEYSEDLPSGVYVIFEINEGSGWKEWDKKLPEGQSKMRYKIQTSEEQVNPFVSEEFDVTNPRNYN